MWTPFKKKPVQPAAKPELKSDGWQNIVTGLGTSRDKMTGGDIFRTRLSSQHLRQLWQADDMAARIVETTADEMVREGWELQIKDDKELATKASDMLDGLDAKKKIREALRFARAYGGGGILIGVNDGSKNISDWEKPLDLSKVRSLDFLTVFAPDELRVMTRYNNPMEANYGQAKVYEVWPRLVAAEGLQGVRVHASRILKFDGYRTGMDNSEQNYGWGNSVLERCYDTLSQFGQSWTSAAHLLSDFSQTVIKMRNLAEALAADKDGYIMNRMRSIDLTRSVLRAVIVDADGEDVDRKVTPLAGLPEMLDKMSLRLAAAARLPVTLLMGQSPSGLNATGSNEVRNFYDQVAALQNSDLRPELNRLYAVVFAAMKAQPETWNINFLPLWQMDDSQRATIRQAMATADASYIANGVLTPEEVAKSRFGGDEYSLETQLDLESRNALGALEEENVAETIAQAPKGQ